MMNARLVPADPLAGSSEITLTEREITIGRSRQNDLCLDDPSVSRVHATISILDGCYILADNGSRHGTMVNEKAVRFHRLAANDLIQVGIYRFRFLQQESRRNDSITSAEQLDHLRLLLDVISTMNSSLSLDQVLEHVIDAVIRVTRAERGFLMMLGTSGELEFRVARNFDRTTLLPDGIAASFSIVERVRQTGESVVLSDVLDADSFSPSRSVLELGIRSVMCVPLKTQERFLGVVYVDSHREAKRFSDRDLEIFHSLASQAALAIEKSQLYEELHHYNTSLEEQVRQRTDELVQANQGLTEAYGQLQQAQHEMIQSERLAAIGRLAAGIAHEINSPLGVITSNVDTLSHLLRSIEGVPRSADMKGSETIEIVGDIARSSIEASERLRRIIKAFEAFTGLDQAALKNVDLNLALESALTLLAHEFGERIRVSREFGSLEPVMCSPGQIHQVFMNLLVNAIRSIEGKGEVRLRSEQMADRVQITIQDTGKGMTSEQLAGLFDTGFAQQGDRVAARLGLVITKQIVREHGGDIKIESQSGTGTTVTLLLPNVMSGSGAARAAALPTG